MSMPFKVCPECGSEYVHAALVCADCKVALEIATSDPAGRPPPAPLPPASELTRVATGGAWEMERLALRLQEEGLSSRVDAMLPTQPIARRDEAAAARGASGTGVRLALYVLPADAESAQHVIRDLLLQDGSGAAAPAAADGELEACPACGAPISGLASACADCGLEFVPVDETCASCGAALAAETSVCPSCGARSPREGSA